MVDYRLEQDSMGELKVPTDALYGAQTQRAVDNFPISGLVMPAQFIRALALIKQAAALANSELQLLEQSKADAIAAAAAEIAAGEHLEQFPVDPFQTGSGTSSNMNANEVIANLATSKLGQPVSPNDDVNMGQSSNDVTPTAIHLSAALVLDEQLLPAMRYLHGVIEEKGASLANIVKTGRTHLMDAMPITMAQELSGWATQIRLAIERLECCRVRLYDLPQGGTAVGTGINAHPKFASSFIYQLSKLSHLQLQSANNFFAPISSPDTVVELSGQLRTLAAALMKISNDLRWMNSGPLAGVAEIKLEALQPGSSIMPGKVNPVIPEAVTQVAAQVIGNDSTITIAGQSGNFQLNVMLPVIAYNLLQSEELLANACRLLADKAIASFTVCEETIAQSLARNPVLITALNPVIGYMQAAAIAKKAYAEGRPILAVAEEETSLSREQLEQLLDPARLAQGGLQTPPTKGT